MKNIIQILIDIIRGKRKLKISIIHNPIYIWEKNNKKQIENLREILKNKKKIKIAFLVIYSTQGDYFDIFVMGDDWKGKFDFLNNECDVIYLSRTPNVSSSNAKMYLQLQRN